MFKMITYVKRGVRKGERDKELLFDTYEEMALEYDRVFVYDDFALNPTCWELGIDGITWNRLAGF